MEATPDEVAGVVDLFGGLTREELAEALAELAFRHGEAYDPEAFDARIDEALVSYHLVALDPSELSGPVDDALLAAGPAAFPELPEDARDLPHIMDVQTRQIDPTATAESVADQFRTDARTAVEAGDETRIETLLDVSYELEAWGGVDLSEVRSRLADSL